MNKKEKLRDIARQVLIAQLINLITFTLNLRTVEHPEVLNDIRFKQKKNLLFCFKCISELFGNIVFVQFTYFRVYCKIVFYRKCFPIIFGLLVTNREAPFVIRWAMMEISGDIYYVDNLCLMTKNLRELNRESYQVFQGQNIMEKSKQFLLEFHRKCQLRPARNDLRIYEQSIRNYVHDPNDRRSYMTALNNIHKDDTTSLITSFSINFVHGAESEYPVMPYVNKNDLLPFKRSYRIT